MAEPIAAADLGYVYTYVAGIHLHACCLFILYASLLLVGIGTYIRVSVCVCITVKNRRTLCGGEFRVYLQYTYA